MTPPTEFDLWYGRAEPPREPRRLRAGPVEMLLDGCDLRYVRVDGVEAVRRLYVAVRDHNWLTIPGTVSGLTVRDDGDRFEVDFDVSHRRGDIAFDWRGTIRGEADGTVRYAMAGRAGAAFRYNRIGFCVLHPPETSAGRPFRADTHRGPLAGTLPLLIEPQRKENGTLLGVIPACERLTIDLAGGATARFEFAGDLFEMEDQRNWTDASFKTYCTPLWQPYPKDARPGQAIDQSVAVVVEKRPAVPKSGPAGDVVTLTLGEGLGRPLPPLGLGMASHGGDLSPREIDLLVRLNIAHLRVDLKLAEPGYPAELRRAAVACESLGCGLELAVTVTDDASAQLDGLAARLADGPPIARVVVFHAAEESTAGRWVELARGRLRAAEFAGGTNAYYCQLNRTRPETDAMDAVAFSINPQVHAFDEASLIETLAAQGDVVRSGRAFGGGRRLIVSPVTLRPRFNPNATGPDAPAWDALPPQVDARQMSLFAAGWAVGSVKHLAEAGADSVTYFETTGWRGLVEVAAGPPRPDLFPSRPGMVFPVYHVFADLAEMTGEVIACRSDDPLAALGLAVRGPGGIRVLIANHSPRLRRVVLAGLPAGAARVRVLDAANALADPAAVRVGGRDVPVAASGLTLDLPPFAVARIDAGDIVR